MGARLVDRTEAPFCWERRVSGLEANSQTEYAVSSSAGATMKGTDFPGEGTR